MARFRCKSCPASRRERAGVPVVIDRRRTLLQAGVGEKTRSAGGGPARRRTGATDGIWI
jgi:hypothetical protein